MASRRALSLSGVACQGSDLTLPADGSSARLTAESGFGQQGTVGTELPEPLVARPVDNAGRPVVDVSLRFQTEVPTGQLERAEVVTDDSGEAAVRVQLGMTEGTQTFEALVADEGGSGLRTTFDMLALAKSRPPDNEPDDGGGNGEGGGDDGNGDGNGGGNRGTRGDDDRGAGNGPGGGTTMTLEPITARETAAADKAGRTRTRKETRIRGGGTAGITAMAMMPPRRTRRWTSSPRRRLGVQHLALLMTFGSARTTPFL